MAFTKASNLRRARISDTAGAGTIVAEQASSNRVVRFGSFEADLREGRLTKSGIRIRLQDQPFQILALLLERPGQLVTRDEIRHKLWAQNTFVEFDDALNTAVRKLRSALNDSADNPRFLETVPRRGYRFVAPVAFVAAPPSIPAQREPSAPVPSEEIAAAPPHRPLSSPEIQWQQLALLAAVAFIVASWGIYWYVHRPTFRITAKDTVVLADIVNTTGESVFDDALRQGLQVGLEQSPFVKVLPERKTAIIVKQMGRSPDERIAGRTAIEVCQRTGSKVTIQGSVASLGTTYLIGLAAIRCDTGEPIANEQVQAKRREDVIDALGQATSRLRARLGESLPSIEKYNAPLEQATTPSLDALNAYGVALSTWDKKGDRASLPFFQKAIELDPKFAMAYGALAAIYHNLGEAELARENTTKAYELRDRVTEAEKLSIESRYCLYVTGDREKAAEVYEFTVQNFPQSAGGFNHLGTSYSDLGRWQKGVDSFQEAMRLDPTRSTTYFNLAVSLMALNQVEAAGSVLAEADKRKFQTPALLQANYWLAFVRGDTGEMQRVLLRSSDVAGAQALLLSTRADTEAYYGHMEKAAELSRVAANLLQHDGDTESAANVLGQAALRDAEAGDPRRAHEFISQAQQLSQGQGVVMLATVVASRLGDVGIAETLSRGLNKQWPAATFVQKYWLPVVRAQNDLHQSRPSQAVEDLASAAAFELANPPEQSSTTIYPAYVRGRAYVATGDGSKAAAEFQKLIDHPGMILNSPLGVLARLGMARAYKRAGDLEKSRSAYHDFLEIWKDADPNLVTLKQAKAEYAAVAKP
jgi:eukaryotic-like serine/threonine-protein kinase